MSSKRFSIVIPAYNAENTIGSVLDSIVIQNPCDTEVIVVNDGSGDNTAAMAASYSGRLCLKIIDNAVNRGLACASAAGIDAAEGVYVLRCDADDRLPPGTLDAYRRAIGLSHPDIVAGKMSRITPDGRSELTSMESVSLNDMPVKVDNFSMCARAFRRELLQNPSLRSFPGLDCWEDLGVTARVYAMEPQIVRISDVTYEYRIASCGKSLSTSRRERLLNDHIAVALSVDAWMRERGLDTKYREFLDHLKFAAKVKFMRGSPRDPLAWQSTFPEINRRVMSLRHVALIHRLLFASVAIMPRWIARMFSRQNAMNSCQSTD